MTFLAINIFAISDLDIWTVIILLSIAVIGLISWVGSKDK